MDYSKCGQCEFMYKNEALQADCACLNAADLPEFCPLAAEERTGHAPDIDGHLEQQYEELTHLPD